MVGPPIESQSHAGRSLPNRGLAPPRPSARAGGRGRLNKHVALLCGVIGVLVAAIAAFVWVFQWNWLRGPVDAYLSARLQRQVTIHGDLAAHIWSWTPSAVADGVTVAEPSWAGPGDMAVIPKLTLSVDLGSLLRGQLVLPLVAAEGPRVTMIRDASGRDNWTFGLAGPIAPQPLRLPAIGRLSIAGGRLTLTDARRNLTFTGAVSSNEGVNGGGFGRGGRFTITGKGTLNRTFFTAQLFGGPLLDVDPDRPYPFTAQIRSGPTLIVAKGAMARPFDLGAFKAATHVVGPDLSDLYFLTGLALPNTPPYDLTGFLARSGANFDMTGIHGRLGESDLSGRLNLRDIHGRDDLTGDLASHRLKLADLTAVIGGAPRNVVRGTITSPKQALAAAELSAEHRVLPDAQLDVARVRKMDADVRYQAETVDAGPLSVRQVVIRVRLDHGLLTLDPASLVLPQGALSGRVQIDARPAVPKVDLDITLAHANLGELVSRTKGAGAISGDLDGRLRLAGEGASVRQVAANATGGMEVAAPGGQVRRMLAELMGVDVDRSLFLYLSKDNRPAPLRCAVAEFRAQNGVLTAQQILIDTGPVLATGKGRVDLRNETIDIAINGKPKHFQLIRLAAPITIKGRLDQPRVGIDVGKSAGQLALSAVLGAVLSPFAAIVPFVAPGTAKDADCGALLRQAAADGAPIT